MISAVLGAFPGVGRIDDPKQVSPLVLAYIGDTIYDLFVRTNLVSMQAGTAHKLHLAAAAFVCAKAQAVAFRRIEASLTDEEISIYKRGRNAHMGSIPKNASISDYRIATGLEALLGYLYLCGNDERIITLIAAAVSGNEEREQ